MPNGEPVSVQVLEALKVILGEITSGPLYYTKVSKVVVYETDAVNAHAVPMIAIVPGGSDYDDPGGQNVGELLDDMDIRLLLILKTATNTVTKLLRFERDVKTALLADVSLGGVVVKTSIGSSTHTIPEERDSVAFTDLSIRVRFRTPRSDLNTST